MLVANIVPISEMRSKANKTGIQFCYQHMLRNSPIYLSNIQHCADRGDLIIIAGLHKMRDPDKGLPEVSKITSRHEIMLPSYHNKGDVTVEIAEEMVYRFSSLGIKWMAVPQGRDIYSYFDCFDRLVDLPGVVSVGISLDVNSWELGGRLELIAALRGTSRIGRHFGVHLLDIFHPLEIVAHAQTNRGFIDSVSTAFPAYTGISGMLLDYTARYGVRGMAKGRPTIPLNFFNMNPSDLQSSYKKAYTQNLSIFERYADGLLY